MKVSYRGHTIEVSRQAPGALMFSVFDPSGCERLSNFEYGSETVRGAVGWLKERVDAELATDDPWMAAKEPGTHGGEGATG